MCFWSHETTAYASPIEEEEEQRDFKRECQTGPGTARYDSASWNSAGSSEVGGSECGPGPESVTVLAVELERKSRRGVKS